MRIIIIIQPIAQTESILNPVRSSINLVTYLIKLDDF